MKTLFQCCCFVLTDTIVVDTRHCGPLLVKVWRPSMSGLLEIVKEYYSKRLIWISGLSPMETQLGRKSICEVERSSWYEEYEGADPQMDQKCAFRSQTIGGYRCEAGKSSPSYLPHGNDGQPWNWKNNNFKINGRFVNAWHNKCTKLE